MMKFYNYLNENTTPEEATKIIHRECKPYLKLIEGKMPLFRAFRGHASGTIGKFPVRKNRKPLGFSEELFSTLNRGLEEYGHNRRDQSISCKSLERPGSKSFLKNFGILHYIFPIGNFSFSFIEASDFNSSSARGGNPIDFEHYLRIGKGQLNDPEFLKEFDPDKIEKLFHTDENFDHAYRKGGEIWINCDYYYASDPQLYEWDADKQIISGRNR